MNNVELRHLQAFVALMSERSVTRASLLLGVGQPALSQTLARLREHFGDPLLVRTRAGMVPTERALEVERVVRSMLGQYDKLMAEERGFDPATSKCRFVVSIPEYAEHVLLPPLLARIHAEAPGIRVETRAPLPDRAVELLESGDWDLRVAWLLAPAQSLRSMALFQDRLVCLARSSHPAIQGRLDMETFLNWPHLRPIGTGRPTTATVLDEALAREGARFARPFLVQNQLTIPSIVSRSDMLAIFPVRLANSFAAQYALQLLEIPLRVPRIRYAGYWHERSQRDPAHRWLRAKLRECSLELGN